MRSLEFDPGPEVNESAKAGKRNKVIGRQNSSPVLPKIVGFSREAVYRRRVLVERAASGRTSPHRPLDDQLMKS